MTVIVSGIENPVDSVASAGSGAPAVSGSWSSWGRYEEGSDYFAVGKLLLRILREVPS